MDEYVLKGIASRRDVLQGISVAGAVISSGILDAGAAPLGTAGAKKFDYKRWWTQDYRIVQTNNREIDCLEDPRDIARALKDFGANVIVSDIGGISAFYPTKLEYHHKSPYLKGDFVGEMIEAAHSNGIAYIGRFDLSKSMKPTYDAHPEWFMVNRDGTPREYAGTYQTCPNGGWINDYSNQIMREALTLYKPDAVFFNGGGYSTTDYTNTTYGNCACNNCRTAFRAMFGKDLPKVDGPSDPNWRDYVVFQQRTTAAHSQQVKALFAQVIPGVPTTGGEEVGRGELQRRVSRPAPEWPYQGGESGRSAKADAPGRPFSATSTAHVDYPWRQATETAAFHLLRFAQQLATGCRLDLYLMGTLADQNDQSYLPPLSKLYKWEAANYQHYEGMELATRVGLYTAGGGRGGGGGGGIASPWARYQEGSSRGAYISLLDSRIPFQYVSSRRVADGSAHLNEMFDVIVVPHVLQISAAEAAALDKFVSNGGLLISSGLTGGLDSKGELVAKIPLASFPFERYDTPSKVAGWSLDPTKGELRFSSSRVPIDAYYFGGTLKSGVSDLVPFAPDQAFGPPELCYAIPGAAARTVPGVATMAYGKGRSIHIPWLIDWQYYRDGFPVHQQLMATLIERYAPAQQYTLTGQGPVELTVMKRKQNNETLLHVINYAGQKNGRYDIPPSLHGLSIGVKGSAAATARALVAGQVIKGVTHGNDPGRVWYALPPVGTFEVLSLGA